MMTLKQLEYWKEGEKWIKLGEIENQILNLNKEVDVGQGGNIELSAGEKAYRNDLVSNRKKLPSPVFYCHLCN